MERAEFNELLYERDKDLAKQMGRRDLEMKAFIIEQFENHNALEDAHREILDERLHTGSKNIAELDCILNGNGKDGLVMIVDRLYQSRWVVSVLAVTVLAKILADIFLN